jgi:hypothetical protein
MDSLALGNSSFIRLDNSGFAGNATLDGIAGGVDGYFLNIFVNAYASSQTLTINDDNSSTSGDGIKINDTSLVITGDGMVQLIYEGDEGVWQVLSARDTSGAE